METDENNPLEDRKELVEDLFEKQKRMPKQVLRSINLRQLINGRSCCLLVARLVVILFLSFSF